MKETEQGEEGWEPAKGQQGGTRASGKRKGQTCWEAILRVRPEGGREAAMGRAEEQCSRLCLIDSPLGPDEMSILEKGTHFGKECWASKMLNDLSKGTHHCTFQRWSGQYDSWQAASLRLLSFPNNRTPTTYHTIHVTFPCLVCVNYC